MKQRANQSPIGTDVQSDIEAARRDPAVRAELDRLAVFEDVAVRVLRLRIDHGLTREQLAERLGITVDEIAEIELGQTPTRPATLERLASTFELSFPSRPVESSAAGT